MRTRSLVFIDSRVAGYQSLIDNLDTDTQWVLLDDDQDGVLQMQSALVGYTDLDAIHVISHGSTGTLYLGSTVLNSGNLDAYRDQLSVIGNALTESGDILFYGCSVAQGETGVEFITSLAQMTESDVAASDDATSNHFLYGDDILEISIGNISTLEIPLQYINNGPLIQLATLPYTITPGSGALITLDPYGDYAAPYNSFSINNLFEIDYYRFYAGTTGNYTIAIWDGFGEFNMNSRTSIYNSNGDAISSKWDNTDYYYDGFYHELSLQEGWYYIGVTATKEIATPAYFNESNGLYSIEIGGPTQIHMPPSDTDSNDQISEAISLGIMSVDRTGQGNIDVGTDVDMWSFTVTAGQRIAFDIDRPSGTLDSYIRLFNSSGTQLAFNDDGSAPNELYSTTDSWLEYTFTNSGAYYLGISNWSNSGYSAISGTGDVTGSTGPYELNISVTGGNVASKISGVLPESSFQVEIRRFDEPNKAISLTERTWIVIHGRNGNLDPGGNILALAESISQQRPNDQILILDWTSAATDAGFTHENWIPVVGEWASDALQRHGFLGSNLNLVGHSWGSLVAAQLAEGMDGVSTIIALDPAENATGTWNPDEAGQINFARDSAFSWAFYSRDELDSMKDGIAGSETTAPTADESFVVTNSGHGLVVNLFANIVEADDFNQLFNLQRLLNHESGPWLHDRYVDNALQNHYEYEALIDANGDGTIPNLIKYVSSASRIEQTISSQWTNTNHNAATSSNDTLTGGPGVSIDGLAGIDTVTYSGNYGTITHNANGTWTVGSDTLTNIERLQFVDRKVALDITDNALETMQFIGVIAPALKPDLAIRSAVLSYFDQGRSMTEACQLALDAGWIPSDNTELVKATYKNVFQTSTDPDQGTINSLLPYVEQLGDAGFLAAVAGLNINVDLVGLQQSGMEYA